MQITELTNSLNKIHKYLSKAEDEFNKLPPGLQDIILQQHSSDTSLNHFMRWGTQVVDELITERKLIFKEYKEQYD